MEQALLLSTRNPESASSHVMGATGCSTIVYSPERSKQVEELKATNHSLQVWVAPGEWELFDSRFEPVPVIKEPEEDPENRIAVYIHSSGTTGEKTAFWSTFHCHDINLLISALHLDDRPPQASPNDQRIFPRPRAIYTLSPP